MAKGWGRGKRVDAARASLQPSRARQVMSNGANINVSVLFQWWNLCLLQCSSFSVFQPYGCYQLTSLASTLCQKYTRAQHFSGVPPLTHTHPTLWHTSVRFLLSAVRHETVHTFQIMSLTFQGQKLSNWARRGKDLQLWFGVGASGGGALLSSFGTLCFKVIKSSSKRWRRAQSPIVTIVIHKQDVVINSSLNSFLTVACF